MFEINKPILRNNSTKAQVPRARRSSSIQQHHTEHSDYESKRAEALRDSLSSLRDSLGCLSLELEEEEVEDVRRRTSSVGLAAAKWGGEKSTLRGVKKAWVNEAKERGTEFQDMSERKERRKSMTLILNETAELAAKNIVSKIIKSGTAIPELKNIGLAPSWQESHRRRGSSIFQEVAESQNFKTEVKRRGSLVAGDARAQAVVMGVAHH